jgi:hypothetical protein
MVEVRLSETRTGARGRGDHRTAAAHLEIVMSSLILSRKLLWDDRRCGSIADQKAAQARCGTDDAKTRQSINHFRIRVAAAVAGCGCRGLACKAAALGQSESKIPTGVIPTSCHVSVFQQSCLRYCIILSSIS